MNLFPESNGAIFSDCRKYRYVLWRSWDESKGKVMFIGLNPSTANESSNDPTIRRVISFAKEWGFGGVYMLNLFALVSPYPEDLKGCADPVGENDAYLLEYSKKADRIIYAYGSFLEAVDRAKKVITMLPAGLALAINKDNTPRHPLYVPKAIKPVIFEPNKTQ